VLVETARAPAATRDAIRDSGGRPQTSAHGVVEALVPRASLDELRADPSVESVSVAPVASEDAVTSAGVARIGADAYRSTGASGAGVKIVILDQAFGDLSRLDTLAGTELPVVPADHRKSFDATYGLSGRDYYGTTSMHGERVAEVTYDVAPGAEYWYVNYHTSLEFGQAVDYLINQVHPDVVVHSNSFLFGPFDGTGWFARQVDRAAAAGILWVNSAGNYRMRHWEGAWADANGDGSLDIAGHGDSIPIPYSSTARPACDVSWTNPSSTSTDAYSLGLYLDAAGTQPALDAKTGQPIASTFVADPEPHADLAPAHLAASATYYLRVKRVGNPDPTRLTLFCRDPLPSDVDVTASSSPTPGDAAGALSVGAFDVTSLKIADYSTEGPTDDGRIKPDIAAPTAVQTTSVTFTGTSAAAPHVGGAAALLWPEVAAERGSGSIAQRVRERLRDLALDMGAPGPDERFGVGRARLDTTPPVLGATTPAAGVGVGGAVPLRLPLVDAGTLDTVSAMLDGAALPSALGADRALTATFDSRTLPDGIHHVTVSASDESGNVGVLDLPLRVDNTAPSLGSTQPAANAPVSGVVALRLPLVDAGPIASASVAIGGAAVASTLRGATVTASLDTRALADGVQHVAVVASDGVGNRAVLDLPLLVDNTPPALTLTAPPQALAGAVVRVGASADDALSGIGSQPIVTFGDGGATRGPDARHRYARSGTFRVSAVATDVAGNRTERTQMIRVVELRLAPAGRRVLIDLGRTDTVTFAVHLGHRRVRRFARRIPAGHHTIALGVLGRGSHVVVATARGFRARTTVRIG
jgi:hypothetical protein